MTDAAIHLRVPAALKGLWVRASRAAGVRLTDWIIEAVEARMSAKIAPVASMTPAQLDAIPTYTPAQVRAAREAAGHTQTQAAATIYRKLRTWQDWEAGVARADPALIELYLIKTGQGAISTRPN